MDTNAYANKVIITKKNRRAYTNNMKFAPIILSCILSLDQFY